jgi:cytochrome P450
VIAEMIGVPDEDRHQVFHWTEESFGFDPDVTPDQRREAATAMFVYADELCQERQRNPQDDLMSVLIDAEVDGHKLTQMQIDLFFLLLQNAGSETTRNLITSGTIALLEHPDQLAWLREDLSGRLPQAIEELLRWATPILQFTRRLTSDTVLGGQEMAAGEHVALWYPSANRDELVFDRPFELDLSRDPNEHVAFGSGGPHFCLGANLARLEGRIIFETLLTRIEGLRLDADPATLPRVHSNLIDGPATLPLAWDEIVPAAGG